MNSCLPKIARLGWTFPHRLRALIIGQIPGKEASAST